MTHVLEMVALEQRHPVADAVDGEPDDAAQHAEEGMGRSASDARLVHARWSGETAAMSTFFIVNATVTDPDLLASYRAATAATLEGHDVQIVVSTNDAQVVEGTPVGQRVVVLKFPDERAFQHWYQSPAYQDIIGMRLSSTDGFAVLADGRD